MMAVAQEQEQKLVEATLTLLKAKRAKGEKRVYLPPAAKALLFAPVPEARSLKPSAPAATVVEAAPPPLVAPATTDASSATLGRAVADRAVSTTDAVAPTTVRLVLEGESAAGAGASGCALPGAWQELQAAVSKCSACGLHRSRTKAVFGEGNPEADLMFIGDGGGYSGDANGRLLAGPAGEKLGDMIKAMQFERDEIYVTNIIKCRPPGNRTLAASEIKACLEFINRQIDLVKPCVLVMLGATPVQYLLGESLEQARGKWLEYRGIPTMATHNPALLLRSTKLKKEAWEDLQQVMRKFGKDPAETMRKLRGR